MSFDNLFAHADELLQYMLHQGYSQCYRRYLVAEINWLKKNGDGIDSYESACHIRESETDSLKVKYNHRSAFGILKRFDVMGMMPNGKKAPLFRQGAYPQLCAEFKKVLEIYRQEGYKHGLKELTINNYISNAANFLLFAQQQEITTLDTITEEISLSFFTNEDGTLNKSDSYRKSISLVFKADLGEYDKAAKKIVSYLPQIRKKRKNIQYLQPEESSRIHDVLENISESKLSLRDRAIGTLLYYTGIRGCDILALTFANIDWEHDEINILQNKTSVPLTLPLMPVVGNALYDYITIERQDCEDPHIFLCTNRPDPLGPKSVSNIVRKIYSAAGIRQNEGDRQGTYLFRYNAVNTLLSGNTPRPVVSAIVGHEDPASLDYYTFADIEHLRECALSIDRFPVKNGIFDV